MEEVKELCDGLELENEDVYMATTFGDFIQLLVRRLRGDDKEAECAIAYVSPRSPAGRPGCTGRVSLHTAQAPTPAGPGGHPGKPGHQKPRTPRACPLVTKLPVVTPSSLKMPGGGADSTEVAVV